jgi:hypothetical protein
VVKRKYNLPKLASAIADVMLIVSQAITMHALYEGNIILGTISLICGTTGRIIARFFHDEDNNGVPDILDTPGNGNISKD